MILTVGRIILAPVFFLLFKLADGGSLVLLVVVWLLFLVIEVSDLLDGYFARLLGQESEIGKVLDPLADALCRLTYFVAFASVGIFPFWILLLLLYRELGVAYIRVMVSREGVMLAARISGKLKAWGYAFAGGAGILVFSLKTQGWLPGLQPLAGWVALGFFVAALAVSLWSFTDYVVFFLKKFGKSR